MLDWLLKNKEWIFSGIGIPVISFFSLILLKGKSSNILTRMNTWFLPSQSMHSEQHRAEIEKAVFEMRDLTSFDLCWTGIRNDNHFIEFCLKDYSETWLIQEMPEPNLTADIKRQIRIVNRHLKGSQNQHQSVLIIPIIYRTLSEKDKASLFSQLQLFKETESLSPKITFNIWDKTNIMKALQK